MTEQRTLSRSEKLFGQASRFVAGGVASIARGPYAGWKPFPLFIDRGEGAYLYDVDGNRYLDYCLGLGVDLLGHAHPRVIERISKELANGNVYAAPYELISRVAKKLVDSVPSFDKVNFCNSGTDVVQMALRLARAYTGKEKIVKFEGHYHGWIDNIGVSQHPPMDRAGESCCPHTVPNSALGMSPRAYENVIVLPWNDIESLERTIAEQRDDIAAVITEPINCNTGVILPKPGYLEAVRKLTEDNSIALIFDEVITGFRIAKGGAQVKFGVTPDLTTMAKAIGGGFALSAYGGKMEYMHLIDEGKVLHAGTTNANRAVMAAADAALDVLCENDGAVYQSLNACGERLAEGLRSIIAELELPAIVQGIGPVCQIYFTNRDEIGNYREALHADQTAFSLMWKKLLNRGVYLHPGAFEDIFLSVAHTESDIDLTLAQFKEALREVKVEYTFQMQ